MSRPDMDTNSNIIRLLTSVSATLTSNGDINNIINTVLLQLREYANAALIELWVLNPEKELLIRQDASFEKSNRKIADFLAARNTAGYSFDALTESVCRVSYDYILISETTTVQSFRSDIAMASGLNTNLVYPLLHKDNLLGVLIVHNDLHFESVDNLLTVIKPIAHHLTTTIVLNKVNIKLEEVLKPPEELVLNNVVSSLDDVVFEYDKEGNFKNLWCNNDSVLQLMPKEYVGKSMTDAYHALPELTGAFIQDFENAISNNEVCYRDFSLSIKEETRWFNSKITPLLSDSIPRGFSQRITDITDQKKVDLAINEKNLELRSAHRELKEIIENTSEIIFKLNQDDSIIFVSPEFERSLGFPGSEMVGTHIQNLIHPDDRKRFKNELIDARKNGKSTSHSIFRAVDRSGIDRWFNISAKFVRTSQSESFIGIVFAQDVTDLKLAMDSLSASEERYRSIVNALGEGIVIHDNKGIIIGCNQSAERIFDLPKGGALGDSISKSTLNAIKENGSPFPVFEFPAFITLRTGVPVKDVVMGIYKRNGDLVWIKLNTEPVYYSQDKKYPDGVVASMIDITEKKKSEQILSNHSRQLQEYSERISGILDSITDGFIAVDGKLEITLWNKVIERLTGISAGYAVGKSIKDLKSFIFDSQVYENYNQAIKYRATVNFEYYVPDLQNWYESSVYPFGDGLFIYFRDISTRKQQENLLDLEKRVLEYNATHVDALKATVDYFLEGLENIFKGMLCSVLVLDEDGKTMHHLSAPKLPKSYTDQINGVAIGPNVGSCGTAMFTKKSVIVSDISTDPLWANYRELAASHNLRACWSFPIKNVQNEVLATIAVYYQQPASPTIFQLGIINRVESLLKVIIENKKADYKIRLSNERYLLAIKATNDAIWDYDLFSNTIFHGDGYTNIFGYRAGRTTEPMKDWSSKIHPNDRERVLFGFSQFLSAADHKHWVYDRGFLIYNQQGKVARIVGSMQDITEKKQLEKQLLKQELDKHKLVAQAVVDAQEKERAEIGKELHDNVNQILSTAKLYLELARSDEPERLSLIKRSIDNIHNAINEIRTISRSLVPPSIGDLGILESIQDLIENVRATKKLHVEFYYSEGIEMLINEKQQLMLFRIIQEQVNNVLKHSEASNLIIELMIDGPIVDLTISDNGKGFEKDNIKMKRGVGLNNIASRTELFNGEVNLITAPGKGCTLNIHIPIINS